jgi:hypothetical protein
MATWVLKASSTWTDYFNAVWLVEIYQDLDLSDEDSSGEVTPITFIGSDDPLIFRYGPSGQYLEDDVIKSTECTLNMVIPQGGSFSWLYTDFVEHKFKIKVSKDSTVWYYGFLLMDLFTDDLGYNRRISVSFSDQLNLIGSADFLDGGFGPTTPATLLDQLVVALEATGLDLPINIACHLFHTDMVIDLYDDPFNQAYLSQRIWTDENFQAGKCGTVIEEILKVFQCRIFQSRGEWWIIRLEDLEWSDVYYKQYSSAGVYIGQGILNPQLSTSTSLTKRTPYIQRIGGELLYSPVWKNRSVEVDYGLKPSLITGLNADVYWSDEVTHVAWTNLGIEPTDIWWHVYSTSSIDGSENGFMKAYTNDRIGIDLNKYLASPKINVYATDTYVLEVSCGRSPKHVLRCSGYVVLELTGVGQTTYWYNSANKEWVSDAMLPINEINFPPIDGSDVAKNVQSISVEIATPIYSGQVRVICYIPYRNNALNQNEYFYIKDIAFKRVDEDVNIPNGEVRKIVIDNNASLVPPQLQVQINGGVVIRGTTKIDTDRFLGLLSLNSGLTDIDDTWVEIHDQDSDEIYSLKSWILHSWHRQHYSLGRTYQGDFIGQAEVTSVLKITEFGDATFGELFVWDDMEFHAKSGIWSGTWIQWKTNKLKTGYVFNPVIEAYSIDSGLGNIMMGVAPNGGNLETKDEYRSNEEIIAAGEVIVTYLTPFSVDNEVLLDPAIMGITVDGEILWATPYWDSDVDETEGFKINFDMAVTIKYTARIKK